MTLHAPALPPDAADTRADLPKTFLLLLASILLLNVALELNLGFYGPGPIAFYAVSFAICVYAGVQVPLPMVGRLAAKHAATIGSVLIVIQVILLLLYVPVNYLRTMSADSFMKFPLTITLVGMLSINALAARPVLGRWQGVVILAAWAWLGGWLVHHTDPFIDTFPMTQESCKALVHGINPFGITFPDIYYHVGTPYQYPPGFAKDGLVLMGYSYPPLTLLMSLPGYVVTGDHRFSIAVASVAIAAMLFYLGKNTHGVLAAGVFMTCPRMFSVMESAWTEPLVLVLLAGSVWCAFHWRAALPWVFGLFLCSKQHMILFAPAALWLLPRPLTGRTVLAFYGKAFAIGIVITLPFVLWNFKAFIHSVIALQLIYQARLDALSFPPFFHYAGWPMPPRFTSLLLVPVAYGLAWWRVPRTVWGFALTLAFVAYCTLAFDQAFLNRNFFVMTAMVLAVASLPRPLPTPAADALPAPGPVEAAVAAG